MISHRALCLILILLFVDRSQGKAVEQEETEEKTKEIQAELEEEKSLTTVAQEELLTSAVKLSTTEAESEEIKSETTTTAEEPAETTEATTTSETTTREPEQCNPDPYCQGEVLPPKLVLNNTFILCDRGINPVDRCCLPTSPHLVCYNIRVDAQHLNYNSETSQMSTDITALCKAIVDSQKKILGQYTAASIEAGEGTLIYLYDKWKSVQETGSEKPQHIKDLACGIVKKNQ